MSSGYDELLAAEDFELRVFALVRREEHPERDGRNLIGIAGPVIDVGAVPGTLQGYGLHIAFRVPPRFFRHAIKVRLAAEDADGQAVVPALEMEQQVEVSEAFEHVGEVQQMWTQPQTRGIGSGRDGESPPHPPVRTGHAQLTHPAPQSTSVA